MVKEQRIRNDYDITYSLSEAAPLEIIFNKKTFFGILWKCD